MNTFTRINLSQLRPCDQAWEDMKPHEQGRLCQQCSKTIIDFRNKTDREIAEIHAFSEESVCGLYRPSQRKLPSQQANREVRGARWQSLSLGVLGLLFSENVQAQIKRSAAQTEQLANQSVQARHIVTAESIPSSVSDSIVISGQLFVESTAKVPEPAPFVTVAIPSLQIGTSTDMDGKFALRIPITNEAPDSVQLKLSYVGYQSIEYRIPFESKSHFQATFVQNTLSVFYINTRLPLHKRVWRKITWPFRRKHK